MALFPTTPKFKTVDLKSMSSTIVDYTQSKRRNARQFGGHLWSFKATYRTLTKEEFMPVWAFCMGQEGAFGVFEVIPPETAIPRGQWSGTPLVNGADQTGKTLILDGATPSITGWARAGDIINIAGQTKVYLVTADANSDGSGNVTLPIYPPLISSPANNSAITSTDVKYTVSLSGDIQEYSVRPPLLYGYEVSFIEAV